MTDKLPDNLRVEDEPIFGKVNCNDATMRTVGRVRLSLDLMENLECDYPFDVLPNEGLASSGRGIFHLEEYGVLFHELDLPYKEEIYPWHTQWISVPTEFVDRDDLSGNTVVYAPSEGLYIGMTTLKPDRSESDVEIWNESGDIIYSCSSYDIGLFEVPDEVLFELLPEEYNSDIASQSI